MKQVSSIGVLIGAVTDIVATNLFTLPIGACVMIAGGILNVPKGQQQAATLAALHANVVLYGAVMLIGGACSILGGYVAAWIAKRSEMLNGALSSFLCVAFALYAIVTGKADEPLWLAICMLPISPALGAAGGYLRRAGRQRAPKAA
jgi:hypothetical protein